MPSCSSSRTSALRRRSPSGSSHDRRADRGRTTATKLSGIQPPTPYLGVEPLALVFALPLPRRSSVALRLCVAPLLLIAAGALAWLACGGREEARPDLAFVSARDGDYAIYEMDVDGEAQHGDRPRTPTSSQAACSSRSSRRRLPMAPRSLFWSRRNGTFDIFVMNADGTGPRRDSTSTTGQRLSHRTRAPKTRTGSHSIRAVLAARSM